MFNDKKFGIIVCRTIRYKGVEPEYQIVALVGSHLIDIGTQACEEVLNLGGRKFDRGTKVCHSRVF